MLNIRLFIMSDALNAIKAKEYYKKGEYEKALNYYELLGHIIGYENVTYNVHMCKRALNEGKPLKLPSINSALENELLSLKKENNELKVIIKEQKINISERFRELAILTQMLEEKN